MTRIGKSFYAKRRVLRPGHGVLGVAPVVQAPPPPPPVPEEDWGDLAKRLRASRGQSSAAAAAQGSKRQVQHLEEPTLQTDLKETTLKNEQGAVEAAAVEEAKPEAVEAPTVDEPKPVLGRNSPVGALRTRLKRS